MSVIRSEHLVQSVADALQFISCRHPRNNTGPAEWSKKIIELKLPVTAA